MDFNELQKVDAEIAEEAKALNEQAKQGPQKVDALTLSDTDFKKELVKFKAENKTRSTRELWPNKTKDVVTVTPAEVEALARQRNR